MAEQRESHETKRYRESFQNGRVKRLMWESSGEWVREPAKVGQAVIDILDAKKMFEDQALADTYLSQEARNEIAAALREETHNALDVVGRKFKEALTEQIKKLTSDQTPQTDTAQLARQVELQRAEGRLERLAAARVGPVDIIARADGPMLDALEQNPQVFLGSEMPRDMAEIINARRYELASPAEKAVFDKRAKLVTLGKRFDVLLATAAYEADTGVPEGAPSALRPATVWA